jgi:hypothetical protein
MTNEERLSRFLHQPKKTRTILEGSRFFESFVLVGLPLPNRPALETSEQREAGEPALLFQFPTSKKYLPLFSVTSLQRSLSCSRASRLEIPGLADLCFPSGITTSRVSEEPKDSMNHTPDAYEHRVFRDLR